jgi:Phytanoyl-CoA dioxygenase (PhyH)
VGTSRDWWRDHIRRFVIANAPPVAAQRAYFWLFHRDRDRPPLETGNPRKDDILSNIAADGFAVIPDYFNALECGQAIEEFEAAAEKLPEYLHVREDRRLYGAEHVSRIAETFISDPLCAELAEAYTRRRQQAAFTMANRIDADGSSKLGSGGGWHRDGFARELKIIVYLSDVDEANGPFRYIRGSHRSIAADMKRGRLRLLQNRISRDEAMVLLPGRLASISAPAGTAIAFDDSGIHSGAPIRQGSRWALTNYIFARDALKPGALDIYEPRLSP